MENENTEEEGSKDHLLVIGDAGEDTVGCGSEYETVRSLDNNRPWMKDNLGCRTTLD